MNAEPTAPEPTWLCRVRTARRWAMRLLPVVLVAAAALYVASGFFTVRADEVGLVRRFGRVVSGPLLPGLHYRLPWPFGRAERVAVRKVLRVEAGFWPGKPLLYRHAGTVPTEAQPLPEPYGMTGEGKIVQVRFLVQYRITDPVAYLDKVVAAEWMLRAVVDRCVVHVIGSLPLETVLITGKHELADRVRKVADARLNALACPVRITSLQLVHDDVPGPVQPAYQAVVGAQVGMRTAEQQALSEANRTTSKANSDASRLRGEAHAHAADVIKRGQGDVDRLLKILPEFRRAEDIARRRMYMDMVQSVFQRVRTYIVGPGQPGRPAKVRLVTPP